MYPATSGHRSKFRIKRWYILILIPIAFGVFYATNFLKPHYRTLKDEDFRGCFFMHNQMKFILGQSATFKISGGATTVTFKVSKSAGIILLPFQLQYDSKAGLFSVGQKQSSQYKVTAISKSVYIDVPAVGGDTASFHKENCPN